MLERYGGGGNSADGGGGLVGVWCLVPMFSCLFGTVVDLGRLRLLFPLFFFLPRPIVGANHAPCVLEIGEAGAAVRQDDYALCAHAAVHQMVLCKKCQRRQYVLGVEGDRG